MDKFGDKLPTKIQTRSYRELKQNRNNNYESISLMNIDPSSFNKSLAHRNEEHIKKIIYKTKLVSHQGCMNVST